MRGTVCRQGARLRETPCLRLLVAAFSRFHSNLSTYYSQYKSSCTCGGSKLIYQGALQ